MKRRAFVQVPAALAALPVLTGGLTLATAAHAQAFPGKPVRLVIPSAPGGTLDIVGRLYAERMARTLKQPVLIDNMSGAGTVLATRHVLAAVPDGHTLLIAANTLITLPYVDKTAGYSPADFTGISSLSRTPMMLVVGADSPYRTLADLIAEAKKSPGSITFATVGIGSTTHLPAELFAQSAGIKLQMIPYKASPLALPDVVSGRVTFILGATSTVSEMVKSGKMRALASTNEVRSPAFPNVPTFIELGHPDVTYFQWLALFGSNKLAPDVRKILSDTVDEAKKDPDLQRRLDAQGAEMAAQATPEQFNAFLRREEDKTRKVVRDANIDATGK